MAAMGRWFGPAGAAIIAAATALGIGWLLSRALSAGAGGVVLHRAAGDDGRPPVGERLDDPGAKPRRSRPEPWGRLRRRAADRRAAELARAQLADVASIVGAAVRAGRTVPQAIEEAAVEVGEPVSTALDAVRSGVSVGVPLDRALESLRERPGGPSADLFATVLQVGRRAGGSLPALLDVVASSIRERAAAEREVGAMTVQARLSGRILTVLPAAFFALTALTSGDELVPVLLSPTGAALVGTGLLLQTLGALWVRRIVRVEV